MKLRDHFFECLMACAVLLFMATLALKSVRDLILVDASGAPMDRKSCLPCPACGSQGCFLRDYPVYDCLACGRVHTCRRSGDGFVLTAMGPPHHRIDRHRLAAAHHSAARPAAP